MKKILVVSLVLALGVLLSARQKTSPLRSPADGASWVPVGPAGGEIKGLAFNPSNKNIIFALAYGYPSQVFKSVDGGQGWTRSSLLNEYGYALAADPTNADKVYILASSKILKSTDGAATWQERTLGTNCYGYNGKIAVSPSTPNVVYATGYYVYDTSGWKSRPAVYKSTDSGQTWSMKTVYSGSSTSGTTYGLAVDPTNANIVYAGIYYYQGSTFDRLYKSTDGGDNWNDKTGSIVGTVNAIVVDPTNASKLYAGTPWGIFRSVDGGQSWAKNEGYAYANALDIDPSNPSVIYGGYNKESYKSTNGGVNWTRNQTGVCGNCAALLINGNRVYFGSSAGVYRSDDSGLNWTASHSGLLAAQIPALCLSASSPNVIYAEVATNGFFKSTDYGASWTRMPDFYRCESVYRIVVNPANVNDLYILAGG